MSASNLPVKASAVFLSAGSRVTMEDFALIQEAKRIFVIADGFGGSGPGAAAAKTACEAVQLFLAHEGGDLEATMPFVLRSYFSLAGNVLFNALIHANRKVRALNQGKGVHERGGASVLAGYMDGDLLALANVGACTVWLIRGGQARELVVPRTLARLQDPFNDHPDPALRVPLAAVGFKEDLEPEIVECRIRAGDWLLFLTDGVPSEVRECLILLQNDPGLKNAGERCRSALEFLKDAEKDAGAFVDNAGAALILF
jgi:serine/threonine protein phosphatase PrpC